jgi:biotin synthase
VRVVNIENIRVSVGSASVLGLGIIAKYKDPPTTCYIMTYREGHCIANCGFCPQARSSHSSEEMLSRVSWPVYSFKNFLLKLKYLPPSKKFKRICVQTLNYPENYLDLIEIIKQIRNNVDIPISVAIPPMSKDKMKRLNILGVQRVGIALDGATPEIFEEIKGSKVNGPYGWDQHINKLNEALEIFSEGFVSTHIIVGLGETEEDVIVRIEELNRLKILISLFAFTPIKGTKFEHRSQPSLISFRILQLGRYLIVNRDKKSNNFTFNDNGSLINFNINKTELKNIVYDTDAFLTSGCPGCNRPYYTSKPSGPIYNYPRMINDNEKQEIYRLLLNRVN